MGFDLGLEDDDERVTREELEAAARGNIIPEGRYRAQVTDVKELQQSSKGNDGLEFHFEITEGVYAGSTVKDALWFTENTTNRQHLYKCRLGLLTLQGDVYVRNKAKATWLDVIGTACTIDVVIEEFEGKSGKGKKNKLSFEGLLPADAPLDPKKDKPAEKSSTTAAAKKPTKAAKPPANVPDDM